MSALKRQIPRYRAATQVCPYAIQILVCRAYRIDDRGLKSAIPTSSGAWHSSVQCHLGTLNVGDSKTIRITTTLPRLANVAKTFGAFAWSLTPDPQPGNNYGEVTVTP